MKSPLTESIHQTVLSLPIGAHLTFRDITKPLTPLQSRGESSLMTRRILAPYVPVTVIIPAFNVENYLKECVTSLYAGQTPDEVIIVDDGSTDKTAEIAATLASELPNVRLLTNESNIGIAKSKYSALRASKNEIIAFVDSDDFLESGAILDAFERFSGDIDGVLWELWRFEGPGNISKGSSNKTTLPSSGKTLAYKTLGRWEIHGLGMFKKSSIEKGFQEIDFSYSRSTILLTRTIFANSRMVDGSTKRYFYRNNINSLTQKTNDRQIGTIKNNTWYIKFSKQFNDKNLTRALIKEAVRRNFWFFRRRKEYTLPLINSEIYKSCVNLLRMSEVSRFLLANPFYLFIHVFLLIRLKVYFLVHKDEVPRLP